jgi:hypothetical protein
MENESQGQSVTPETSTTTQQPESLDSVYQKYNVEAEAQTFNPQRERAPAEATPVKVEPSVPDPVLDQEGFKKWASGQNQFLQTSLQSLQGELTHMRVERMKAKEEADIKSAVSAFKSVTGEDVDDDIAEVALGQKARKDPKFLAVYQNRGKNPAAWNAAVRAYANEFKGKTSFKIDPQIAENQRAAKQSIQGSQSRHEAEPSGIEAELKNKTGKAFERSWRNYVDGNTY